MLTVRQALDRLWPRFLPMAAERLPLLAAQGRALADDIIAERDLPRFDHSAMDGYAVRHAELTPDCVLPVRGEARAAAGEAAELAPASALRIFTGGRLPLGADTVVIQEDTRIEHDGVRIVSVPKPGANVRRAGSDLRAGAIALRRGTLLGPGEIGLLAALDRAEVSVPRRPKVAILPTGDELRELGTPEISGSVVNSNAYSLAAAVTAAGGIPEVLPIARDRLSDLRESIATARDAQLLLTIGGVSVGDYDRVGEALRAEGFAIEFHKVAIKPGKPLMFGSDGALPVIGLPGNPVSSFVTFEVFVRPCIYRLCGRAAVFPELLSVQLAAAARHSRGRLEFARARLHRRGGVLVAELHPQQGSGSQPSISDVNALVLLPADQTDFAAGAELSAIALDVPLRDTPPYLD